MNFKYLDEFQKDLKKLSKKIPSLKGDLENFKKFIIGVDFDNNKRFITLKFKQNYRIVKTRLMVRSLKGSSMTRLIFSFCITKDSIDFIELYLKSEKNREDENRIDKYLDSI